jgi:hypothetical protein
MRNIGVGTGGSAVFSAQVFTPGEAPIAGYEGTNYQRIVTAGQTGTDIQTNLQQRIENVRTFAGEQVTYSFFAKAASGTPSIAITIEQNFGSGGSSTVTTHISKIPITTSWARYSVTFNVPSVSGKTIGANSLLNVYNFVSAGSNANANTGSLGIQSNTFEIWGVQLEAGSVATPFRRNANSLQGELAACQRYYYRAAIGTNLFGKLGQGWARDPAIAALWTEFPVTMRVDPTSVEFANTVLTDATASFTVTAITLDSTVSSVNAGATSVSATGQTLFRPCYLRKNNNAAGFIAFSAEL